MPDITQRLKSSIEAGAADRDLLAESLSEITELRKKSDALEEILIVLVRTQLPFDAEENREEAIAHFSERYRNAMREASNLLGLNLRSTITRTEPRT
ncbi:hypothetical protein [Citrifermentans bremense]|uniref:hypothetical protein n=1 Tax=Citrifermentans bremense TaxID=60035 RepID=UPI000420EE3B|nr:hypothetical protein [Citrifermentans bremense]